jgi:hypothetical protein
MNPEAQLQCLLDEYDFKLARQRKHKVYKNPDGKTFVMASTPSDRRSSRNALSTLKRICRPLTTAESTTGATTPTIEALVADLGREAKTETMEFPAEAAVPASEPIEISLPVISPNPKKEEVRSKRLADVVEAKNERFVASVHTFVERACLLAIENNVEPAIATNAVKVGNFHESDH